MFVWCLPLRLTHAQVINGGFAFFPFGGFKAAVCWDSGHRGNAWRSFHVLEVYFLLLLTLFCGDIRLTRRPCHQGRCLHACDCLEIVDEPSGFYLLCVG